MPMQPTRYEHELEELREELEDAKQQLVVLRPGGLYAWKSKHDELQAEIAAAREACPAVRMQRFFDASLLTLVEEEVSQLFRMQSRAEHAEAQCDVLRAALVCLVGVDGRGELEQLEAVMRLMPAPAEDKAATIDAIRVLIATVKSATSVAAVDPAGERVTG